MTTISLLAYLGIVMVVPMIICWRYSDPLIIAWCRRYAKQNMALYRRPSVFVVAVFLFQLVLQIAFFIQLTRIGRVLAEALLGPLV